MCPLSRGLPFREFGCQMYVQLLSSGFANIGINDLCTITVHDRPIVVVLELILVGYPCLRVCDIIIYGSIGKIHSSSEY